MVSCCAFYVLIYVRLPFDSTRTSLQLSLWGGKLCWT